MWQRHGVRNAVRKKAPIDIDAGLKNLQFVKSAASVKHSRQSTIKWGVPSSCDDIRWEDAMWWDGVRGRTQALEPSHRLLLTFWACVRRRSSASRLQLTETVESETMDKAGTLHIKIGQEALSLRHRREGAAPVLWGSMWKIIVPAEIWVFRLLPTYTHVVPALYKDEILKLKLKLAGRKTGFST